MAKGYEINNDLIVYGAVTARDGLYLGDSTTGATQNITAQGSGANVDIGLIPKGTGQVSVPGGYSPTASTSLVNKGYADVKIAGKDLDTTVTTPGAPEDGKALVWDNSLSKYKLNAVASALTAGDGINIASGKINLGGQVTTAGTIDVNTLTGAAVQIRANFGSNAAGFIAQSIISGNNIAKIFSIGSGDITFTATTITFTALGSVTYQFAADYSANYVDRSIPDVGYAKTHIGGKNVHSNITGPTGVEDGYAIVWDNVNSKYKLSPVGNLLSIGTTVTGGTPKSVLWIDGSTNIAQDNANFAWDYVNTRLGIGTNTPGGRVHIKGAGTTTGKTLYLQNSSATDIFYVQDSGLITGTFTNDDSQTRVLVATTGGAIYYRNAATLGGGGASWLLASGGTLTGVNTITSNSPNQLLFNGTWTATANNQNHMEFGGVFTSRNTASDTLYGYVFDPTLTRNAGNPATQTAYGVYINPTFTNTFNQFYSFGVTGNSRFGDGTTATDVQVWSSNGTNWLTFSNTRIIYLGTNGGNNRISPTGASNIALNIQNSQTGFIQNAMASAHLSTITITPGTHTSITAASELQSVVNNGATWTWTGGGSWTGILQRFNYWNAFTLTATSATTIPAVYTGFFEVSTTSGAGGATPTITDNYALGVNGALHFKAQTAITSWGYNFHWTSVSMGFRSPTARTSVFHALSGDPSNGDRYVFSFFATTASSGASGTNPDQGYFGLRTAGVSNSATSNRIFAFFTIDTVNGNINLTGGTTTVYGIDYNPGYTSATGMTHYAMRLTSGGVLITGGLTSQDTSSTLTANTKVDIRGIGASSSTYSLRIADNTNAQSFAFRDDGYMYFGGSMNVYPSSNITNADKTGRGLSIVATAVSITNVPTVAIWQQTDTDTSGNKIVLNLWNNGFNPASGTTAYTSLLINPTYNSAASGDITGIYYNPTTTAVGTGKHYAWKSSSGSMLLGNSSGDTLTANTRLDITGISSGNIFVGKDSTRANTLIQMSNAGVFDVMPTGAQGFRVNTTGVSVGGTGIYPHNGAGGYGITQTVGLEHRSTGGNGLLTFNFVSTTDNTATSGTSTFLQLGRNIGGTGATFVVSSGTATYRLIDISPTWNVTGGTPVVYGIDYNPTITAFSAGTHYAIRTASGGILFTGSSGDTLTANTRVDVRGITGGNILRLANTGNQEVFNVKNDSSWQWSIAGTKYWEGLTDGRIRVGTTGSPILFGSDDGATVSSAGSGFVIFNSNGISAAASTDALTINYLFTVATGTASQAAISTKGSSYTTSGAGSTARFAAINLVHTINQTINTSPVYGIDYNPTVTAIGGTHYSFRATSGLMLLGTTANTNATTARLYIRTVGASGNAGFYMENSTPQRIFAINEDGSGIFIGASGQKLGLTAVTANSFAMGPSGGTLTFQGVYTAAQSLQNLFRFGATVTESSSGTTYHNVDLTGTYTLTGSTGSYANLAITSAYASSAGTYTWKGIEIVYSVNQTGTSSGLITGIDYNPTLTAVLGLHYGFTFRPTGTRNSIGTATPTATLHIVGSGTDDTLKIIGAGTTTNVTFRLQNSTPTDIFKILDSGQITITTPANDNALTQILMVDGSGILKYRTVASLPGGGGGISNTAGVNELMKSDGTNAVPSGLFTATNGNITLGSTSITGNRTIITSGSGNQSNLSILAMDSTVATQAGSSITIQSGAGNTTGSGGNLTLKAGTAGGGTSPQAGIAYLYGGDGAGTNGAGGGVVIQGGGNTGTGTPGSVTINGGANSGTGQGGSISIVGGNNTLGINAPVGITGSYITLYSTNGVGFATGLFIQKVNNNLIGFRAIGDTTTRVDLSMAGQDAGASSGADGGSLFLYGGQGDGAGKQGNISLLYPSPGSMNWQSMQRGLFLYNSTAAPTGNPSNGIFSWIESGTDWKWRDTGGIIYNLKQAALKTVVLRIQSNSIIATGLKGYAICPYTGTIRKWYVRGNPSATVQLDVWKANGSHPTVANTITASDKPKLTAANYNSNTGLVGWTTSVSEGDIFAMNVDSNDLATDIELVLYIQV